MDALLRARLYFAGGDGRVWAGAWGQEREHSEDEEQAKHRQRRLAVCTRDLVMDTSKALTLNDILRAAEGARGDFQGRSGRSDRGYKLLTSAINTARSLYYSLSLTEPLDPPKQIPGVEKRIQWEKHHSEALQALLLCEKKEDLLTFLGNPHNLAPQHWEHLCKFLANDDTKKKDELWKCRRVHRLRLGASPRRGAVSKGGKKRPHRCSCGYATDIKSHFNRHVTKKGHPHAPAGGMEGEEEEEEGGEGGAVEAELSDF